MGDSDQRWVYDFADGSRDMRDLLGGKGANVAEMTRVLGRRAGAGRLHDHHRGLRRLHEGRPGGARRDGRARSPRRSSRLEEQAGKKLGDDDDPLLVSVRSGARESMPGMLDTVLNLGLNDESVEGLAKQTENDRFAWDSYRRFVQMFGNVARGIQGEVFEEAIKEAKEERGVEDDTELDTDDLKALTAKFKERYQEHTDEEFPQDPTEQLRLAIRAVFDSWTGERAVSYRRLNRIPDDWGTAVDAFTPTLGFATTVVSVTVLAFFLPDRLRVLDHKPARPARFRRADQGPPSPRLRRGLAGAPSGKSGERRRAS